jgi:hypothetical protein
LLSKRLAPAAIIAALVLVIGAAFATSRPTQLTAAPAELGGGYMTGTDCQARLDAGTSGLSAHAVAWLQDCVEALGGPTGSPSSSPSTSPTATPSPTGLPTTSPTPSPTSSSTPTPSSTSSTPSPTPTLTTSSGPRLTGCFDRLAACGYPHLGNTGVPAGTVLTAYTGPATIRTAGTVIEGKTMGCIAIAAANVTIRRSKIIGPCFYGIDMQSGSLTIEDSEITCVNGKGTGIAWAGFTARRVYIHDCENALEMGQGASVVDSYLSAREATSDGHGDDIQSQGGNDVVIRHNTFAGLNPITSSIITNPTKNHQWTVEDNFLSAGAYTLYCPEQGTGFVVRNNRFFPAKTGSPHSAAYGLTDACAHSGVIWSGNYRDDNLAEVGATA